MKLTKIILTLGIGASTCLVYGESRFATATSVEEVVADRNMQRPAKWSFEDCLDYAVKNSTEVR